MVLFAFYAVRLAHRLTRKEPGNLMWSYLWLLCLSLALFSIGRSVGHMLKIILVASGYQAVWSELSPISGGLNTITFAIVAAVTLYYHLAARTVDQLTRANAMLEQSYVELQKRQDRIILLEHHAMANRMAASLAHETRNPIFTIGSFARGLKKKLAAATEFEQAPELEERVDVILDEAHKLEQLVGSILKARLETESEVHIHSAEEILEDLVRSLSEKAKAAGVTLVVEETPLDTGVHCDLHCLRAALKEITLNAVEASPQGGTVHLGARAGKEWVVFSVQDEGPGIPAERLERIFDPMFSTKELASGLGLSFAKDIIETYGGYLNITTEPGKGALFEVSVPAAQACVLKNIAKEL